MLKREVDFGIDNFGKSKVLSQQESLAQELINLLFLRPGQMPSLPWIGINIKKYLYDFEESLDSESLRKEIEVQCAAFIPYIDASGIVVTAFKAMTNPIILIVLPFEIADDGKDLVVVVKRDITLGVVSFNYDFQDREII